MKEMENCSICLCEMTDDTDVCQKYKCNHSFHKKCISDWNGPCPLCRAVEPHCQLKDRIKGFKDLPNDVPVQYLNIYLEKWNKNELSNKLLKRLSLIEDKIQFWDQDVLNSYFNSNYLELEEKFNYKINNDLGYKKEFTFKIIKKNVKGVIFAHYSGKFKPWTVKGALYSSSFFYQDYYFKLTGNNYHIDNNWKRQAIKDLIKAVKKKEIRSVEKPFKFLYYVIKFLLTAR